MTGYVIQEPCGCYAVYADGVKVSTHDTLAEAEAVLINIYLFHGGVLPGEGNKPQ